MDVEEIEISDTELVELINDIHDEDVIICGSIFEPGRILRELDPIAFRCMKADLTRWCCGVCGDVYDEEYDAEQCCKDEYGL